MIRINFGSCSGIYFKWNSGTELPNWVKLILKEFQESYNAAFDTSYEKHLISEPGIKYIVCWLKSQGYKADYWEMDFNTKPNDQPYILAYGIEIAEDCEKFIELKLRADS